MSASMSPTFDTASHPVPDNSADDVFVFPMSFAQERLWFLDQLDPGSTAYVIPGTYHFVGLLDAAALERSLNMIVQRHEALRTTFAVMDGQPVQVVAPDLVLPLNRVDLRSMPESTRSAELRRLTEQETARPFDLAAGPLLRTSLVQLGDMDHVLLLTMHHIISDAWSRDILFRELSVLYGAYITGQPASLPELSLQYADFAQWQRQRLQGETLAGHLAYWKEQLQGAPGVLELPADRPRPPVPSLRGATLPFDLPPAVTSRLKAIGQGEGATLFMTLLAAFKALIHCYTAQQDIVVGTPVANRSHAEIEGLIGFFVNTLVLRTSVSSSLSFRELLRRVRDVTFDSFAHQELPFEILVRELQPERQVTHNPLFQVMFAYDNAAAAQPRQTRPIEEVGVAASQVAVGAAKFDLTMFIAEWERHLTGVVEYNPDLFDASRIERLVDHFRVLLEAIAADPGRRLFELPLMSPKTRHQVLVEWNATHAPYGAAVGVHRLVEAQAARTPGAPAVIFAEEVLTYSELNRRANQLARHLRELGVAPETCVGVSLPRSPDMAIAVLAILKAGGAYVPLDPSYPGARLEFMKNDAQIAVMLTTSPLLEGLPENVGAICLDRDVTLFARQGDDNLEGGALPDNLAYIIYTSGSTGKPKGVAMPHRALFNLVCWQITSLPLAPESRTLQYPSLSFDVSFQEIFSTWCGGGTLVLTSEETRRDIVRLSRCLADMAIARIFIPPAVLQQLAETLAATSDVPTALQQILVAGEQLQITPAIASLCARLPDCVLHNHYGPTETHLATAFGLDGPPNRWMALPPIGRPLANVQTYVLSADLQPLPVGISGELYIGGTGLARGYLNRPDLTAERFVPDPFGKPGARLYKTGDLVRQLANGDLEFLGRLDRQVKIRGFRIEPGEIETLLMRHPAMGDCAVVAWKDSTRHARLVAYVVLQHEEVPTTSELRRFLGAILPEYMVPSAFVVLPALPQSPNGKLDRSVLPGPESTRPALDKSFVAPRNPTEEMLAGIWTDLLGLERVGVLDNFFDLGGHSLLVTQLASRLRDRFRIELPLRRFFETPTVSDLAPIVDGLLSQTTTTETEQVAPDPIRAEQLLAKLDKLSDAEVEALLSNI
jgi:amino acid adenylation domain-containing protein